LPDRVRGEIRNERGLLSFLVACLDKPAAPFGSRGAPLLQLVMVAAAGAVRRRRLSCMSALPLSAVVGTVPVRVDQQATLVLHLVVRGPGARRLALAPSVSGWNGRLASARVDQ